MKKIERALISVSDKSGLLDFANHLHKSGVEILSTGGTAKFLRGNAIPAKEISEFTGFPEILDGRVKTLHPKVHGGLLGRRDLASHQEEMKRNGISPIDLVVVNLYPFEMTVSKPDVSFEEAIENIDIGGPAMLRSAAKNYKDVAVVVDPGDYAKVVQEMNENRGSLRSETLFDLARKVFSHTSRYDSIIAAYLNQQRGSKDPDHERDFPDILTLTYEKAQILRYGENPHQRGAFYKDNSSFEVSVARASLLHGKEMSYNNYLDANSAFELVKEYREPCAVIVKHNNPCGVALGSDPLQAYQKARETDPISAFGGVIAFNQSVDLATAKEITSTFVEVVIAPSFLEDALFELKRKRDIRILSTGNLIQSAREKFEFKRITGGLLLQDRDLGSIKDIKDLKVVTQRIPTAEELAAMDFAWKVCKHVKSNAIIFASGTQTIGIGAGQMSRIDSVQLATSKAQKPLSGAVMASDAFFPFRDGLDAAFKAGIRAVIQPGGSIKDSEVIQAANEHGMSMVFTGMRHFRH
ncbi:MAG: bifunctional phosphoribosylaminoimidazolecarboxamide formyltransferase/IMP cyclohydrolase [Nitrospirae bacterium]|nr:bifunctional phosphoribosylaminoimidazolecarboxamide formyltransferase/IMP cyclohydrolase [Nitrospirota bacterium]MBI3593552.1 bifunctional phosphoribosylaminoimidazolecarboxamide formyltransferase/IMP cyclohydrolase [Nitrospirota bacterium]